MTGVAVRRRSPKPVRRLGFRSRRGTVFCRFVLAVIIYPMIVTIDGPAGSGKSTAARKLAAELEVAYLDTGAMYRAIAHTSMQRGIDPTNEAELIALMRDVKLELDCGPTHTRVRVDGRDVSEAIRTIEVSAVTSAVAKCQGVREQMVDQQRRIGATLGSFVAEGRDQGSVVFSNADARFVLEASLEKRTQRRYQELVADGEDVTIEMVRDNVQRRDAVDAKQWEPLLRNGAAIVIDTTEMTIHEVVTAMAAKLRG